MERSGPEYLSREEEMEACAESKWPVLSMRAKYLLISSAYLTFIVWTIPRTTGPLVTRWIIHPPAAGFGLMDLAAIALGLVGVGLIIHGILGSPSKRKLAIILFVAVLVVSVALLYLQLASKPGGFAISVNPDHIIMEVDEVVNLTINILSTGYQGDIVISTPNTTLSELRMSYDIPEPRTRLLEANGELTVPISIRCRETVYELENVSLEVGAYGNYGKGDQFLVYSNVVSIAVNPEPTAKSWINASNLQVLWSLDLSDISMTQSHHSSPTVVDIDSDGQNEILLGYRERFWGLYPPYRGGENRVLCATDSGEVKWIFPPLDKPDLPGHILTTPTIADLNGDGQKEILMGRRGMQWCSTNGTCQELGGAVYCLNSKGQELWNFTMNGALGSVTAELQLYDNGGDGDFEIYVASGAAWAAWTKHYGRISALGIEGDLLWSVEIDGCAEWPPLVWDIDQDGRGEIVACLNNQNVTCLNAADGSEIWRFPIPGDGSFGGTTPVAADVDKDGRYEILIAGQDGNFYVLNEKGELEWRFDTPTSGALDFSFPVADIDGDSNLETCFMDDELVYCIDLYTHEQEWTFKPINPHHYSNYNTFADVTGDGEIDVLIVAPCLYILSNEGKVQAFFDTSKIIHEERAENGVWSGDLNGDGLVEILVKFDRDALYCLTTGAAYDESRMPWPKSLCNTINRPLVQIED